MAQPKDKDSRAEKMARGVRRGDGDVHASACDVGQESAREAGPILTTISTLAENR